MNLKNENAVRGYKVFKSDWTCRGFKYEVGKTYEEKVTPEVCDRGFHFCKQAKDCFNYYSFDSNNKVAEVIAIGAVDEGDDKCCTNKIEIVREIPWQEVLTIVNEGKENTGLCNTGNWNTGNWNTGNWNTGNCNTGNWNTGNCNTGNWNTGNWNTGDWNTGNWNTGDWNTGDWNQGDFCTGDFNISDHETGIFCTEEHKIRIFDIETDMTFEQWRNSRAYSILCKIDFRPNEWVYESNMSDEEKAAHPEYKTTDGYLKVNNTDKAFIDWWKELDKSEKQIIKKIPNFNAEKFLQITGIDPNA